MIRRVHRLVPPFAPLVLILFASTPALAQAPGGDTIVLKSGGLYRGTLVDVVPNDHARILLDTGEVVNVPWSAVDHVDANARGPAAPPSADAVARPPAPSPQRIFVHLGGAPDAVLEKKGAGREWAPACASPCDKWLPADGTYRVGGPDIRSSTIFALAGPPGGRVDIDVDPASKAAFVGGIVATSVGYGVVPVGLLIMLFGAIANSTCDFSSESNCSSSSSGDGLVAAGAITAVAGALVGTIGVVEIVSNAHSAAPQSVHGGDQAAPTALRAPAWVDAPAYARALPAAPTTTPVYTFSF
jgi:hypothetical protein